MTDLLQLLGVVVTALLALGGIVYTAKQGQRVARAEAERKDAAEQASQERLAQAERVKVEAEAYLRARGIDDEVVDRLRAELQRQDGQIATLAKQGAEREAHHMLEMDALRQRAERAENRAAEAERRATIAEQELRDLRERLVALERDGTRAATSADPRPQTEGE